MKTTDKTLSEQACELVGIFSILTLIVISIISLGLLWNVNEKVIIKDLPVYSAPFKDAEYGIFLLKNDSVAVQDETGYFEIMPLEKVADYIEKEQL